MCNFIFSLPFLWNYSLLQFYNKAEVNMEPVKELQRRRLQFFHFVLSGSVLSRSLSQCFHLLVTSDAAWRLLSRWLSPVSTNLLQHRDAAGNSHHLPLTPWEVRGAALWGGGHRPGGLLSTVTSKHEPVSVFLMKLWAELVLPLKSY